MTVFEKQIGQTVYREIHPPSDLHGPVKCLWVMETCDLDRYYRIIPDGCADILFEWTRLGARCRVIGTMTRHFHKQYKLPTSVLGVTLNPGGASEFFEQPLSQFTDQSLRVDQLWQDCRSVWAILDSSGIDESTVNKLNDLLLKKKRKPDPRTDLGRLALQRILENPVGNDVCGIAADLGRSRQQITRAVKSICGIGPKKLAKILRLQNLIRHVRVASEVDWASAAIEYGFYDQAHLIREFREFAGTTPGAFIQAERCWAIVRRRMNTVS